MRISDWSSDVCSSDLQFRFHARMVAGSDHVAGKCHRSVIQWLCPAPTIEAPPSQQELHMDQLDLPRRQLLKCGVAAMAVGAIGSLGALHSRQALAATDPTRLAPIANPFGPPAPETGRASCRESVCQYV